jgi:hypothetical protein
MEASPVTASSGTPGGNSPRLEHNTAGEHWRAAVKSFIVKS